MERRSPWGWSVCCGFFACFSVSWWQERVSGLFTIRGRAYFPLDWALFLLSLTMTVESCFCFLPSSCFLDYCLILGSWCCCCPLCLSAWTQKIGRKYRVFRSSVLDLWSWHVRVCLLIATTTVCAIITSIFLQWIMIRNDNNNNAMPYHCKKGKRCL